MTTEDAYVSTKEAADLLEVSLRTIQLWVENGALQAWKTPGGHRRVLLRSVEKMLDERLIVKSKNSLAFAIKTTLTVVLVEDDPDIIRFYELALSDIHPKINLLTCDNGFTGLIMVGQFSPSIVIVDLNLPDMDGFQMIRSLEAFEPPPKKIIVSTALTAGDIFRRGGLPEGVVILHKPLTLDQVQKILLS